MATEQELKDAKKRKDFIKKRDADIKKRHEEEQQYSAKKRAERKAKEASIELEKARVKKVAEAKNDIIKWVSQDKRNVIYDGFMGDKLLFTINKGLYLFTLTVKDKGFIKESSDHGLKNSPRLEALKEKAKKVFLKYVDKDTLKTMKAELNKLH